MILPDFTMRNALINAPKNIISLITNMIIPRTLLGTSFRRTRGSLGSGELAATVVTTSKISDLHLRGRLHDHLRDEQRRIQHPTLRGFVRGKGISSFVPQVS